MVGKMSGSGIKAGWLYSLLCVAPTLLGIAIYMAARKVVPVPLHDLMTQVGLLDLRSDHIVSWFDSNTVTRVIRDSLPHALWAFALTAFVLLATRHMPRTAQWVYLGLAYALIVLLETSVGTFDLIDLAGATCAVLIATFAICGIKTID